MTRTASASPSEDPSVFSRDEEHVSLIVLTHNAARYCVKLFRSLPLTTQVDYEVVVVDNASNAATRVVLWMFSLMGRINRLCLLDQNTLFAQGNNIGSRIASRRSTHLLLLNSDVEVRHPLWLRKLLDLHKSGASAYGYVPD